MSYQLGDHALMIEGRPYVLRLTLGALAELSERLSAPGPLSLAEAVRRLDAPKSLDLIRCLLRPLNPDADKLAGLLKAGEIEAAMDVAAKVIIGSFSGAVLSDLGGENG